MFAMIITSILLLLLGYLTLSVVYKLFLVVVYYFSKDMDSCHKAELKKYALIVPAHNEELIIDGLCKNLKKINYEESMHDIYVIADNCNDMTESICIDNDMKVMKRVDSIKAGKGYAIKHAIENIELDRYDAVLIIDADTYVDEDILHELNKHLTNGEMAIQCYIKIPNREETWFTELLSVSRIIDGEFYHYPKSMLGLSSYLMGSGICFSTELLKKKGWTAFSIAEDWEYYAQLLLDGYRIAFARDAVVYQYESRSLQQATSQRLRWSSGRWKVTKTLGLQLMLEGIRKRSLLLFDASLPLMLPNYSLQINLTLLSMAIGFLSTPHAVKFFSVSFSSALLAAQLLIFIMGAFSSGAPWKAFRAALHAPLFLVWKSVIDILCFTGLYRGRKWVRTRRHQADVFDGRRDLCVKRTS